MMGMGGKGEHKGLAILLAPKSGGGDSDYGGDDSGKEDEELQVAADDVFDAITKGDRKAFAEALHSYVQLCTMKEGG